MRTLSKYRDCMEQVRRDEEILANLRARASPTSPRLDGMPKASGGHSDKTGFLAVELATMEETLEQLRSEAEVERQKLEALIGGIDDERVSLACRLRFIRFFSWQEVSDVLGLWQASSSRKLVSRYFQAH